MTLRIFSFRVSSLMAFLSVPLSVMWLMACATTGGATSGASGKGRAALEEMTQLAALEPQLKTPEDSLVLDLLMGYQTLLMSVGSTDSIDSQTLHRAQGASHQLEYMLRYGGIVSQGREGRVVTLPDGTRLTLQEVVEQLARALLRTGNENGNNKEWKPATDRALEIQKHKPDLSTLVEDANWVLALSAALGSSLPDDVKEQLRHLHESYARGDSHEIIVQQVNDLLPKVKDETLRKELKKLANRSWDRDKRLAAASPGTNPASIPGTAATKAALPVSMKTPVSSVSTLEEKPDTLPGIVAPSLKQTESDIDSLSAQGDYLEALQVLETVEGQADPKWIAMHRQNLGNHYCEDRRNAAAVSFIAARKATQDSTRVRYLHESLASLDSCLFQFPDAPVAAKVRRNRALVEKELNR